jgi:hypothetical protein
MLSSVEKTQQIYKRFLIKKFFVKKNDDSDLI